MRHIRSLPLLFAASLGAVLAISAAARADTVGTAGAVNTTSSGTPPAGPTRIIQIGTQLVENEKIETTGTGSVQVLFIDKTTLNVGPNSSLVIDRFVYNPATTRGELAISLGKGVLRVVGGVATHSEGATIRTPVAAIGLRGGIAIISHSGAKGTRAILGFGHMSVTTLCGGGGNCSPNTVQLSRPGFGVTVEGFNRALASPSRASSQQLAQSNSQLGSHRGQNGGATQQPTDNLAQSYNVGTPTSPGARGVSSAGANAAGANALQAVASTGTIARAAQQNTSSLRTTQTFIAQSLIKPVIPIIPIIPIIPVIPVKPPPPPLTYAMVTSGASRVPYLTGAFAGTGGFKVSPILGYQTGGFNPGSPPTPNTTSRQFQAGLSVTGKGTAQNATLFVMTSQISNAPNIGFTQAGGFTGVTVRNPAGQFGLASGSVSSATPPPSPNTVSTATSGTPIAGFTLNNTNTNLNTGVVTSSQSSNFFQSASGKSSMTYTFNPVSAGTPTFSAGSHPNMTLNGYVGGVMVTANGGSPGAPTHFTTPYVITNFSGNPGDVAISLPGSSSELLAFFNVRPGPGAPSGAMNSSSYVFGSTNADTVPVFNGARGAYINPSNFAARDAVVTVNGVSGPASSRNGATVGFANQQLVTAESVGANTPAFLSSISTLKPTPGNPFPVSPCACQTQWGFWSAFNGATNSGQLTFEDQGPLLLWVGGTLTTVGALSTATGSATYVGHAIANIANPNNITSYLAAGTFSNTVNFGSPLGTITGAVKINGLDNTNYAGTVNLVPSTVTFNGTLASTAGSPAGRTAALNGSFFQGATSPFGEMGGSLILNGPRSYLGSGIFAAARKP